jgi:hypothetical protein
MSNLQGGSCVQLIKLCIPSLLCRQGVQPASWQRVISPALAVSRCMLPLFLQTLSCTHIADRRCRKQADHQRPQLAGHPHLLLPLLYTDVALCYTLRCCALQTGDAASKLAISDLNSSAIHIYDVASGSEEPISSLSSLHASPVAVMRFNAAANTVISSDAKGERQEDARKASTTTSLSVAGVL